MAYVLDTTKRAGTEGATAADLTFEEWFTADDGLQAGDYIMVCASNQTGINALTLTSTTGTWERLDNIDSPRVGTQMRSQLWWHKYDGTNLPSVPTAAGGASAAWVAFAWVVRDAPDVADQSWIDANARTEVSSAARVFTIDSVTTTAADCLLLTVFTSTGGSAFETPDNFWGVDLSVGRVGDNSATAAPVQRIVVASRAQYTAGATPTYDYVNGTPSGVRSQYWTIAIKNKTGGVKPVGIQNPPTRIFDYYANGNFASSLLLTSLSTIHATIDGQSTFAPASISGVISVQGVITNNPPILDWFRRIQITPPLSTTGISGVRWDLPAPTDYTTGLWCLFFQRANASQDDVGGVYHYFEDSSGNWSVYRFLNRTEGSLYNTLIRHLPDETRVDGSVTPPDLTDITKRGFAYHQISSNNAARLFHFRAECIQPFNAPLTLTGGGPGYPITARRVARMLSSGAAWNLAFIQGQGQQVITMPYQLGDGTVATYVDDEAQALEYPRVGGVLGYTVLQNRQEIRIKASASDTMLFDAGIKGTSREQDIIIDPSSNTSATYGFAVIFLGWKFTGKTGINVNGGTFIDCAEIDAKGAQYNNCVIKGTTSTNAAIAFDANSSMTGTTIDVTGANAAFHLELGASVTEFTLTNCTFIGIPGTDKVHVKATSGTVNITLDNTTLTAGDITSAGATVNLITPQKVVSIAGITAGSRLQIYNVTTATEIVNQVVAGTSYSAAYEEGTGYTTGDTVRVRLAYAGASSAKLPYTAQAIVGTSGWSILASQQADDVYASFGIDGSTVTEYVADFPNVQIDINDPDGSTRVDRLYAWFVYTQASDEDGIRQWFGGIVPEDEANFRIVTSVLDLKIDNASSTGVTFVDGRRLYRDDGASPLVASTTGGGSIAMFAGKVYTSVVSTASPVITGDISQVPAAVQTGLTAQGYTTARASKIDNADVAVSSRATDAGAASAVLASMAQDLARINELHLIHGLQADAPLRVAETSRTAGDITQAVTETNGAVVVTRQ